MALNVARLLEGKKCVITAGAHGLGFAIAQVFAHHGAVVAICGRGTNGGPAEQALRAYSGESFFYTCDLSDAAQTKAFGDEVLRRFGVIDVLVNNAGINTRQAVVDIDMDTYERIMTVNLKSALVLMQKFVPAMRQSGRGGTIVNVSSMNCLSPSPTTGSYAASKGGLNALTKVLATELGKYGIRVNAVCPGWIATGAIGQDVGKALQCGGSAHNVLEAYNGSSPLMAPARSIDTAHHVLFLASDLSAYITGFVMKSDGAAVMQAHACAFAQPEDAAALRAGHYDGILDDLVWQHVL